MEPSPAGAAGRFDVLGQLGAGGMGVVYRAHDRERGSEVALKVLRNVTGSDVYRFKREFRALADVAHPNLVGLYDLHTNGDEWFLTMELVDGVPFVDWVRAGAVAPALGQLDQDLDLPTQQVPTDSTSPTVAAPVGALPGLSRRRQALLASPLDLARLESALYQLCDTVQALHQAGKLHRDLKPANILVDGSGRVVVLDFGLVADVGIAEVEHTPEGDRTPETRRAVGTPAYMSPEQDADRPLSPASDWYSVGVILYEALTGRRPIDLFGSNARRFDGALPAPQKFNPAAPARLAQLCLELLAADPEQRPGGEAVLAALGREPSPASRELALSLQQVPFVGREHELEALRQAFGRARAGRGSAVFVRGGSGMGKSTLVRRFLEEVSAEAPEAVILRGRCYECESVPFKTLDTVVDALSSHLIGLPAAELAALLPPDVEALGRLFPATRRVPAIAEPNRPWLQPPDPLELRRRAFAALRVLLTRLSMSAPLVITLDDLQWGDVDSGNFLADLLLHPEAPPLLLLLTARSEDETQSPLLAALRRAHSMMNAHNLAPTLDVEEITLAPLSNAEARALVRMVGGGASMAGARDVVRDAGGSPLFLAEMARAGKGNPSLDEAVRARVTRLGEGARALANVCAVAARPLRLSIALRAAGIRQEGKLLATLRSERLLRVRRVGAGEAELEPYHDRIRAAITGRLSDGDQRSVHRSLAQALTQEPAPDHEALLVHWLGAGEPTRAATHAARAATAAAERLAFHRAADLYALALEHGSFDAAEQHGLQARIAYALKHAGNLATAALAFRTAAAGATDELERLELRRHELELLLRSGQYEAGLLLSRELLKGLGFRVPDSRGGAILAMLGQRLLLSWRGLEFVERQASDIPIEQLQRIELLRSLSIGMGFINPAFGRALQTRLLRESLDMGEPQHVGVASCLEVAYLAALGGKKSAQARALGERTIELGRRLGNLRILGHAEVSIALLLYMSGRWREAQEQSRIGEQKLRVCGEDVRWELAQVEFFAAAIAWQLGDARELVRRVSTDLRDAEERGDVYSQRGLRGWRANVAWLVIDRPGEARAHLDAAAQPLQSGHVAQLSHYYELLSAAQIDLYEGDAAGAYRRFEVWPAIEKALLTRIVGVRIEGNHLRARAALAVAAGTPSASERDAMLRVASECARRLQAERMPWGESGAAAVRAGIARLSGDRDAEVRELRDALAHFDAAEMALYAAAVRRRLAVVLGPLGGEGAALGAAADAVFTAQAIGNAPALCRMMLGFAD